MKTTVPKSASVRVSETPDRLLNLHSLFLQKEKNGFLLRVFQRDAISIKDVVYVCWKESTVVFI